MMNVSASISKWPTLNSDAMAPHPHRPLIDCFSLPWMIMVARHLAFCGAALWFASFMAAWITGDRTERGQIFPDPILSGVLWAVVLVAAYWPLKFHLWSWWAQSLAIGGMFAGGFAAACLAQRRADAA